MQDMNSKIQSTSLLKAFESMKKNDLDGAENILNQGLEDAESKRDLILCGLHYSGLGILYKLKKDFRKAWKFYEKAERLIPEDPALKIISARLLVDYFGQYDTVIQKMEKLKLMIGGYTPFMHEALTIQGMAYLKKGDKKKAATCLEESMSQGFKGIESATNIDFQLVENCIRKKLEIPTCKKFLADALQVATIKKEAKVQKNIKALLDAFPA